MFRRSPSLLFGAAVRGYESGLRRKVPQWVLTLDRDDATRLLDICQKLRWKLSPKMLVVGEERSGPESLWAQRQTRLDAETEIKIKGYFHPVDLQDMPIDPAEMVARALERRNRKGEYPEK